MTTEPVVTSPPAAPHDPPTGPSRTLLAVGFAALIAAAVVVTVAAIVVLRHRSSTPPDAGAAVRVSGLPATISTPLATLMQLGPLPTTPAPDFVLRDQSGHRLALHDLRGKAIVLEFMDPNCVDICPIVSQEYLAAYHDLGVSAANVVFLAIDVNPYHLDTASLAKYSAAHGLDAIPQWHFLGGSLPTMQKLWAAYHVAVSAPNATADVVHTSVAYFIDPAGRERYVALPVVDHTSAGTAYLPAGPLTEWGTGISLVVKSML